MHTCTRSAAGSARPEQLTVVNDTGPHSPPAQESAGLTCRVHQLAFLLRQSTSVRVEGDQMVRSSTLWHRNARSMPGHSRCFCNKCYPAMLVCSLPLPWSLSGERQSHTQNVTGCRCKLAGGTGRFSASRRPHCGVPQQHSLVRATSGARSTQLSQPFFDPFSSRRRLGRKFSRQREKATLGRSGPCWRMERRRTSKMG
jgi:hypothetical protein